MARYSWGILFLILATSTALNVQFQEADTSVSEDEAYLKLSVTMDDSPDADVTVEIVPKTIQQYIASGGKLPRDFQSIDPAEEELDYNSSTIQLYLLRGQRQTKQAKIAIFYDLLTEMQELFVLELRIVEVNPPNKRSTVSSNRNITFVRIRPSRYDNTGINLMADKLVFNESDGTVSDALFIQLDRAIEPNITLHLSQSILFRNVPDLRLPEYVFIPSETLRVNVPFEIIDDEIAENDETITISIVSMQRRLYTLKSSRVNIVIQNNDIPIIGFSKNGTAISSLQMVEGETQSFCVTLLEPQASQQWFQIELLNSTTSTNSDFILNYTRPIIVLVFPSNQWCFSIRALDNFYENQKRNITYHINMNGFSNVVLEPSWLRIELIDNDGAPMKPEGIELNKTNSQLHISWMAEVNKYKPIEKFVVVVTTVESLTKVISRRQTYQTFEEFYTNNTFYIMEVQDTVWYIIQICASNNNKRNCSSEAILKPTLDSTPKTEDDVLLAPPTPAYLGSKEEGLGRMGVIAVIVGPSVAFALSILLILMVLCCRFWGERRHYYPSHQEKILMASNAQMRHYYRQRSSTSSVSTDWTLASSSNYFTPSPSSTLQKTSTLGTPV